MNKVRQGSLDTVERERERESISLFDVEFVYSTTHTDSLNEIKFEDSRDRKKHLLFCVMQN